MVREANKITSDKVAMAFIFHPTWFFIFRKNVNFLEGKLDHGSGGPGPDDDLLSLAARRNRPNAGAVRPPPIRRHVTVSR